MKPSLLAEIQLDMANQEEGRESLQQDEHQRHIHQPEEDPRPTEDERVEEEEKKEEQSRTNQAEAEEVKPLKDSKMDEENKGAPSFPTSRGESLRKRTSSRSEGRVDSLDNSVEANPTIGEYKRSTSSQKSMPKLLNKKWKLFKWIFILLNVGLELSQAVLCQEAGEGKMKGSRYRKLVAIFSSICLTMSLLELVYEGQRHGVKWESIKQGGWSFPYPTKHGRIFGRFALWFGLISAAMQFSLNIASLVLKRGALKFDHLGLLLSVGYFFAALRAEHVTMVAMVKCCSHGSHEVKGKFVEGVWEFECPRCPPENRV